MTNLVNVKVSGWLAGCMPAARLEGGGIPWG